MTARKSSKVVSAEMQSKAPHLTKFLRLEYRESEGLPDGLEKSLNDSGWVRSEFAPPPPLDGVAEVVFVSHGTGLFRGWTKQEAGAKMQALASALKPFGIKPAVRKLTMGDCL